MYNKEAMDDLKKLLTKRFPNLIHQMILFGSRVENKEKEFSDYDILLILNTNYDWKLKRKIRDTVFDLILNYEILTDIKFISKNELNSIVGTLPFIQNALKKGLVL